MMKQMVAPEAPVEGDGFFGDLNSSFFRKKLGQGEIFFARNRAGAVYCFPVLEDGRISKSGVQNILEREIVCAIHPHDIGIKKIQWTDEMPAA